jgi:hypothetical protein
MHSAGGSCGGYSCSNTAWSGKTGCHGAGLANEFWPNAEIFKIHRSTADGAGTYGVMTDETVRAAADLVVTVWRRADSGAATICDEGYFYGGCRRNNFGNNVVWEINASANQLYLVWASQYSWSDAPCDSGGGDSCNYSLIVEEGPCPAACVDWSTWYGGVLMGAHTVTGAGFLPDNVINGNTGASANNHAPAAGWPGSDDLWQIDVLATSTVRFSGCNDGGYGAFNGRMALYDCEHNMVASNNDGCGAGGMPRFTVTLYPASAPYYLVVDGRYAASAGAYGIGMAYF